MSEPGPALRIGYDERRAAIAALDEHLTAGRIDHEEYGERMAAASLARTRDELDGLFADLPQPHPFSPATAPGPYAAPTWPSPPAAGVWYDARSDLWLPRGTELATVGRRIGATFLALPLFVVTCGIGYLIWGLVAWRNGQTPALQVLRMRAYRPSTGRVAGFRWMALRDGVGRFVEQTGWLFAGLVSLVLFLTTKRRRSLHDLIAGTVVLYEPSPISRAASLR